MKKYSRAVMSVVMMMAAAAVCSAQEFEQTENPFQREYDYEIGQELNPGVEIGGLRWQKLVIEPKDPDDLRPGREEPAFIIFGFENVSSDRLTATVVILLEDEFGSMLERIECDPERVGDGRTEEIKQKAKILQRRIHLAKRKIRKAVVDVAPA